MESEFPKENHQNYPAKCFLNNRKTYKYFSFSSYPSSFYFLLNIRITGVCSKSSIKIKHIQYKKSEIRIRKGLKNKDHMLSYYLEIKLS